MSKFAQVLLVAGFFGAAACASPAQAIPVTSNNDPAFGRVGRVEIVASIPDRKSAV